MVYRFQDYPNGTSDPEPEPDPKPRVIETKPPEIPKCGNCGEPLTKIVGLDAYHILFKDGQWHKEEAASRFFCGKCLCEIESTDIEDIMKAVGLL